MSEKRKSDHLKLTSLSRPKVKLNLGDMYYEPILCAHPLIEERTSLATKFLNSTFSMPLWISSMTGGTDHAKIINKNLAMACKDFGLGMGLGSCRSLLCSDTRIEDFNIKKYMGDAPLFTNFGVAQVEQLILDDKLSRISEITNRLEAQGIILHVNPLQEWIQPEGDRFRKAPIETITHVVEKIKLPIIVKEVGQGFGPNSLKSLVELPLAAIELAGFGGTNFTLLEQARLNNTKSSKRDQMNTWGQVGHTCEEMISWLNDMDSSQMRCHNFIVSGGITDPLGGYILNEALKHTSLFGMASAVLEYAKGDYEELYNYLEQLREQLQMAKSYIRGSID